jgi:hypothetical protein
LLVVWVVAMVLCSVVAVRGRKLLDKPETEQWWPRSHARREALVAAIGVTLALVVLYLAHRQG